ncbi:hypothetical protein RSAG8_00820, partial [Rhizoctonia solani AG-8 WAC10335]
AVSKVYTTRSRAAVQPQVITYSTLLRRHPLRSVALLAETLAPSRELTPSTTSWTIRMTPAWTSSPLDRPSVSNCSSHFTAVARSSE